MKEKMKAAVLYASKDIRYEDYEDVPVRSGSVKVAVKAVGICGSDIPRVFNSGVHFYPIVLGHEFAGRVVEVAHDVTDIEVGDRVAGVPLLPCMKCEDCLRGNYSLCKQYSFIGSREQGAFSQRITLPQKNVVKFDKSISYEVGAFFEPISVAMHGIFCNNFKPGGDVLILGGGTIGLITMQLCKIMGARIVTVVDIVPDRLALAKKLGADYAVEAAEKSAYDYVFETAGSVVTMKLAFEAAGNKARICFIGTPTRELTFAPKEFELMNRKEFTLTGSWMSYSSPFPGKEWALAAHYLKTGQLKIDESFIYKKFPLSQASKAFELFENPEQVKGKVMLLGE